MLKVVIFCPGHSICSLHRLERFMNKAESTL
jgi:hypothetical protein